jgi:hypothetical protein
MSAGVAGSGQSCSAGRGVGVVALRVHVLGGVRLDLRAQLLDERGPRLGRQLALEAQAAEDAVDGALDPLRDAAPALVQQPPRVGEEEALGVRVASVALGLEGQREVVVQGDGGRRPREPGAERPAVRGFWKSGGDSLGHIVVGGEV